MTTKKQQQQSHISQQHEQIIKTNKPSTKESRAKESRANESTVKEEIKMVNTVSRARPRKYSVPSSISFQCLLCPNNLPKPLLKLKQFQLLETDSGENVHRICSEQFKELNNNHEVISGFSDIVKAQKDLKCLVCQTQKKNKLTSANDHGVCFQCEHPKCVRSYHATCAIGAGFSFDSVNRISKCKFHRGKLVFHKLNKIKFDRVSKIAKNSIIQFTTLAKETYSGLVMTNHSDEGIIKVSVYPHLREIMEIPYDNVLMSDDENIDSTQNIGLMFEKAKPNLKKDRDNYKVIFDDLIVTGINSPYLERSIDDNFITETFIKEEQKGRYARFEWWYFMPKFSTDAIAKYSDDYRSKEPNDPYHLLKLERKLKRQNKTKEVNNHLTKKFKHVSPPMIPLGSSNQVNNNIGNNSYLAQPNAVYFPGVTNPIMVNSHFVPYNQGQNNLIPPPQNVMFMTPPITTDGNPWLNMYQH